MHGTQIQAIARREVVKALGHAPASGFGSPDALLIGQPSHERLRLALGRFKLILQFSYVCRHLRTHNHIP